MLAAVVAFLALVVSLVALGCVVALRTQVLEIEQDLQAPKVSRQPDRYRTMDDAA